MSDKQLFRIDNKAVPIDEMVSAGKLLAALIDADVLVSVEPDYEAGREAFRNEARSRGLERFLGAAALVEVAVDAALK